MAAYDAVTFTEPAPLFAGYHSPHHEALFLGGGGGAPVNPTIQNVTAPANTGDPVHAEIALDPASGTISRVILWAFYPALGSSETIFDGDAFTPNYNGASVKTEEDGLVSFDVIHNAGWPSSPRLFIHANTNKGGMTV